ncbi:hypothetical protein FOA52_014089 [Chlamydomonas sp. UWO 241]|nr:hypothetical protein FOA52_014089 [Chlamydomonas sp. UWO 241]
MEAGGLVEPLDTLTKIAREGQLDRFTRRSLGRCIEEKDIHEGARPFATACRAHKAPALLRCVTRILVHIGTRARCVAPDPRQLHAPRAPPHRADVYLSALSCTPDAPHAFLTTAASSGACCRFPRVACSYGLFSTHPGT